MWHGALWLCPSSLYHDLTDLFLDSINSSAIFELGTYRAFYRTETNFRGYALPYMLKPQSRLANRCIIFYKSGRNQAVGQAHYQMKGVIEDSSPGKHAIPLSTDCFPLVECLHCVQLALNCPHNRITPYFSQTANIWFSSAISSLETVYDKECWRDCCL